MGIGYTNDVLYDMLNPSQSGGWGNFGGGFGGFNNTEGGAGGWGGFGGFNNTDAGAGGWGGFGGFNNTDAGAGGWGGFGGFNNTDAGAGGWGGFGGFNNTDGGWGDFGGFNNTDGGWGGFGNNTLSGMNGFIRNDGKKITVALLDNAEFKNTFINFLCDMKNINYESSRVKDYIDKNEQILLPLVEEHILRNGPATDVDDPINKFKGYVDIFRTYMLNRNSIFLDLIQKDFNLQPAVKVTVSSTDYSKGGFIINHYNEFDNDSYTGQYFKENVLYITAKPKNGKKLKSWVIFKCKLVSNKGNTLGISPKKDGCDIKINYE